MDDAGAMRLEQRVGEHGAERQHPGRVERPALLEALPERLAGHVLHGDVWQPEGLVLAGIVDRDDAGMRQRRGGPRLAQEPLAEQRHLFFREAVGKRAGLHRDLPVKLRIGRQVDDPHCPPSQFPVDQVPADARHAYQYI
jgi:hypothetical protein